MGKPKVGSIVHYRAGWMTDGERPCQAAIVTQVTDEGVKLAVFGTVATFHIYDHPVREATDDDDHYTWHWPEED